MAYLGDVRIAAICVLAPQVWSTCLPMNFEAMDYGGGLYKFAEDPP